MEKGMVVLLWGYSLFPSIKDCIEYSNLGKDFL